MTFIASVIAKKGVAIIADSLVTASKPVLGFDKFLKYLKDKEALSKGDGIKIDANEISGLFEQTPSHTKDYEEKLFKYDNYTAITTAGWAAINSQRIGSIIDELINRNKKDPHHNRKRIETRVKNFCSFLTSKVKGHLKNHDSIGAISFILTHYDRNKEETTSYKIDVLRSSKKDLSEENHLYVKYAKQPSIIKVICDGQNRISERILFGEFDLISELVPKIVGIVCNDFKIEKDKIPPDYIQSLFSNKTIITQQFYDDMKITKLTDLSLQQAVDLAWLLMRIEMDFQKYTEDVPTVGGVIKLAVIDKEGFRFISGDEINRPDKS